LFDHKCRACIRSPCGKRFPESHQCHLHLPTGRVSLPTLRQILCRLRHLIVHYGHIAEGKQNFTETGSKRHLRFLKHRDERQRLRCQLYQVRGSSFGFTVEGCPNAASLKYSARTLMQTRFALTATNCTQPPAFLFSGHTNIRLRKAFFSRLPWLLTS